MSEGGDLDSQTLYEGGAVLLAASSTWWAVAPVIVGAKDRRLKSRNPDHHRKIVRFYRGWGLAAIMVGALIGGQFLVS